MGACDAGGGPVGEVLRLGEMVEKRRGGKGKGEEGGAAL